jgi:hypothetical protein
LKRYFLSFAISYPNKGAKERVDQMLIGFPSIKIPGVSDSFFWWLKGNNFGFDSAVNGDFNFETLSNLDNAKDQGKLNSLLKLNFSERNYNNFPKILNCKYFE